MHERKLDMRYIPLPQAPRNRGFTILLVVLWLALLLYILTHPNPIGFILLGVSIVARIGWRLVQTRRRS